MQTTFTIRVTSSATNTAGTAWGEQPDLLTPSYWDVYISGSSNPALPDGVYDGYCLNPNLTIYPSPTSYAADSYAGNTEASFDPLAMSQVTQAQVDQINWLLAQNFTSDSRYAGRYGDGEVQTAIWKLLGFTDAEIAGTPQNFLTDNGRQTIDPADVSFLVSAAQNAVASGLQQVPPYAFFTTIIDPAGDAQPLILQLQSAKLGNVVWNDQNGNGLQEIGEAGINNVVVELYNASGTLVASTITGDDFSTAAVEAGFYQFAGLAAGSYQVKFIAPAGYTLTTQDANGNGSDTLDSDANAAGLSQVVALAAGESNQTIDAGLTRLAHLGDRVWFDANGNGVQDAGENGIPGATVQLINPATGAVIATTTSDGNGLYGFDVPAGTYAIKVLPPSGYVVTTKDAGGNDATDSDIDSTGQSASVTLTAGETNNTLDAGLTKLAHLGDRVWFDANANGVQDTGENGIAGATVQLINPATGAVIATTTSDANGLYGFDVPAGTYAVKVVAPSGYTVTTKDAGGNDATDSDIDSTGQTASVTLTAGETNNTLDAGLTKLAHLGDRVWFDANANGVQDAGENGIAGVTVQLINPTTGAVIASTTSDGNGLYGFDVPAGTYAVKVVAPSDYIVTTKDAGGNDATDSDIGTNGQTASVTLAAGETNNTLDAGLTKMARLGDRIWLDANANGVQDTGENGIAGVTVQLINPATGAVIASTTSDANGLYGFDVQAGTYAVKVVAPAGYVITQKDAGGNNAADSDIGTNGQTASVTLVGGETNNTLDAGLFKTLKLGDRVWLDSNGNGVQDTGENGIAGVQVKLIGAGADGVFGSADDTSATTTTNSSGNYLFTGLNPGQYKVQVTAPSGYCATTQDAGSNDAADSDVKPAVNDLIVNGSFESVNLAGAGSGQFASIEGWTGNGDTIEVGLARTYGLTGASGQQVVELDATAKANAGLYQDVQTVAGQTYELSVDLALRGGSIVATNTVEVWWRGERIAAVDPTSTTFSTFTFTVTGSGGSDRLEFRQQTGDANGYGGMIDNVRLSTCGPTLETGVINLTSDDLTVDAGLVTKAHLGDRVWLDSNSNGIQDAGETGMAGVNVQLLDSTGKVVATTTTNDNGNYGFDVNPGTYSVKVLTPDEYAITKRDIGSNDGLDSDVDSTGSSGSVTLTPGQTNNTLDAGLVRKLYNLGDRVWLDADANGVQDAGETGIGGVTVKLMGAGADGRFGTADDLSATTTTDAQGNYLFSGLMSGAYRVRFEAPSNYYGTKANIGSDDAVDSDANVTKVLGNNLLINGSFENPDIGTVTSARFDNITGWTGAGDQIKVARAEAYGASQSGATGINVIEMDVGAANTGIYQDVKTTAGQMYQLSIDVGARTTSNLASQSVEVWWQGKQIALIEPTSTAMQTYTFQVTGSGGLDRVSFLQQTGDNDGYGVLIDNAKLQTYSEILQTSTINLAGSDNLTVDAGLFQKAAVGDRVWADHNHNYVQDSSDSPVWGVVVNLIDASGAVVATTQTDRNGKYLFSNVDPGTYSVSFDKANAFYTSIYGVESSTATNNWAYKDRGTSDALDSDVTRVSSTFAVTDAFQLVSGQIDLTRDAGVTPLVIDLDGNGITTVSRSAATGSFDLFGNGHAVKSGWIDAGDAFLAIDSNGNGRVDDVNELFGGLAKGDGYGKLAALDSNHDGVISAADAGFADLRVWQDANGNHVTDAGELRTLAEAGIASLGLDYENSFSLDAQGNVMGETGAATLADGRSVQVTDVYFNVSGDDARAAGVNAPSLADLLGDDQALGSLLGDAGSDVAQNCAIDAGDAADMLRQIAALTAQQQVVAA